MGVFCPNIVPLKKYCTSVPNDPNPKELDEIMMTYNICKESIVIV